MTQVAFLTARYDEEEEAALAAAPGPWSYGTIDSVAGGSLYDPDVMIAGLYWDEADDEIDPRIRKQRPSSQADATGEHIARHDPTRALRHLDANRRIVARCEVLLHAADPAVRNLAQQTLDDLARPYSDHEDYQEGEKTT
jgi:hypothetical protein